MERAIHTPFVPQGVPPVSKPFDLTAPKAVRPPSQRDLFKQESCVDKNGFEKTFDFDRNTSFLTAQPKPLVMSGHVDLSQLNCNCVSGSAIEST